MQKRILVTGGHGFLGSAVARRSKAKGYWVSGLGRGRWSNLESRSCGFDEWIDAGVSLSALVAIEKQFDIIVHCAGGGSVGYSISNPYQDFWNTVESTAEVLEYMRLKNPSALLIYPSSAGVYGAKADSPIREIDRLTPLSPYGYHKKLVEELCESYSRTFGLKVAIVRFFSIYGPNLRKQLLWDASEKLSHADREAVFSGSGGETRDWINIEDATELILKVGSSDEQFITLNGACGSRVTIGEVLSILKSHLGVSVRIKFDNEQRRGDPRFYHADITKAKCLGWSPRVGLSDGIRQYVDWYNGSERR